jgi:acyl carrier protein phosphodiesterase
MNWLAHLVLSEPTSAFRIGNLLPDILPWSEWRMLPAKYQGGIECHRLIDSFTDSHVLFRRSVNRIEAPFRRYGGILVDVFYDHLLARTWSRYERIPLIQFAAEFYDSLPEHQVDLPPLAYSRLLQMKAGDWLCSYRELAGVRRALEGIGSRFRKPVPLGEATAQLELHYHGLSDDFAEFFPELSLYVDGDRKRKVASPTL